jgi:multiple sugar transport system permease protein
VSGLYLLSLGLALLVNQRLSATGFFRSGYFLAAMVSPAVAAIIWSFIFGERSGIINSLLGAVGIAPLRWLGSPSLALAVIAVVAIWQASSYAMIIQLAGLQDIPREYYEAAHVDGAGAWTTFRHITIPLLKPTTTFVVITALIDGFQIFDIIFVMTRGGPAHGTTSTVFLIFQNAFQFFKIGYASAMAVVLFAIIFGFSILLLRLFRQQSLA